MFSWEAIISLMRVAKFLTRWRRLGVVTMHHAPVFNSSPRMSRISGEMLSAKNATILSSSFISVSVLPYSDFCHREMKNVSARRVSRTRRVKSHRASTDLSHALRFSMAKISFCSCVASFENRSSGPDKSGTEMSFKNSCMSIGVRLSMVNYDYNFTRRYAAQSMSPSSVVMVPV